MKQRYAMIISLPLLLILIACSPPARHHDTELPAKEVGRLACKIVVDSGIDLLIHSTRDIRCEFKPLGDGPVEYYKGETGVGFGIDVNIERRTDTSYLVRARHFRPGVHQLAGKYSGVGGNVTVGVTVGNTAPISKQDGSISLQPISGKSSGIGGATGFTYLYLEPDEEGDKASTRPNQAH